MTADDNLNPLSVFLDSGHPYAPSDDIAGFLTLAIQLTTAVQDVHRRVPAHGALNPAIIFVAAPSGTPAARQVQILDPHLAAARGLSTQLAYMAPEQTGRMNRTVDHRTDLYALGAIFYQALTGRLPFPGRDLQALVYAHIATKPIPPVQVRATLPRALSDMILKLLEKDPRDRYQSTVGLLADLQHCRAAWQAAAHIPLFPLGQTDVSERLLLPKKLYGREPARSRLLHALDEADRGRARRVLLAGDAGVGKTALVAELAEPVIARGGLLLTCQAEVQQQMPYTAVISLLEAFIRQLLVLEPAQMQAWQAKLAHALAGHVDRLCKHLPLLGTFLEAPYAAPAETADPQQSLHLALQTCFTTIAAAARPLILFVDDAHTADADSLRLLNDLVKNSRLRLLILWAYRPEPPPAYLQAYVDAAPADDRLVLQPLAPSETRAFLVDALCTTPDACARLAEVIHVRTRGNPFLLHEVLRLLHDQALIHFDPQHRAWRWDLAQIRAAPLADNVVDLLHDRLQQLPAPAQRTLKVAALLGSSFALDLLAAACAQTPAETMQAVQQALALGAVAPLAEKNLFPLPQLAHPTDSRAAAMQQLSARYMTPRPADRRQAAQPATVTHPESAVLPAPDARLYRFAHEQVRTAARRLQPDLPEAAIHRQIGRRLLHSLSPEQRQRHAFLIVGHLNQDAAGQADWAGRTDAAQLNLSAGRDALALVAYESALSLALCGIDWLGMDGGWQTAPVLMRELHLTAAQAATRLGRFEQAVRLLDTTEMRVTSVLDRAAATQERMLVLYLQGKHAEAVAAAVASLRRLGVRLPLHAGRRHLAAALLRTRLALRGQPVARLAALPPMTDERSLMAMEILATATISAAAVNPNLLMLIGLELIRQTQKHGAHPLSAMGYALYGVLLCGVTGQIDEGYAFGQLALRLAPQIETKEYRVFVKYFVHAHVSHWKEPIQATLQPVRDMSHTGEYEYLAVAAGLYPYFTWFINGLDLKTNEAAIAENMHLLAPFAGTPLSYRYRLGQQYYQNLLGMAPDPQEIVGDVYDERQMLPLHLAENDHSTIFYLACHKLTLCYLFGDYVQAVAAAELAAAHGSGGVGTPLVPVLCFYDSLARLALYPGAPAAEARRLLHTVAANQRKMRRWARHSPANCAHRYSLVAAEQARVLGRQGRAREWYDTAVQQTESHDFLPERAVAHEAAARFYYGIAQPAYAEHHLRRAYDDYRRWGALAKVRHIEAQHPALFRPAPLDTVAGLSAYLDMTSVLKAAQILSSETVLPRLLDTLTTILIENAGAQYGCLLLPEGNQWRVASRQSAERGKEAGPEPTVAAMSLVWQVARSREPLLLNDVETAVSHTADPHLRRACPRAILCLPLLDKGELVGVFYMEHRQARHAFSPDRLPPLQMLAGQAAISLKNASLVAGLQAAQENIQASERRFRLLFENAPLGILEVDISSDALRICAANRRAEAIYGWAAGQFAALDPTSLVPEENRHEIQRLVDTVRAGKTAVLESHNRRRDGAVFPVRIIATPAPEPHGLHMIVAVEDITPQQQRRTAVAAIEEDRQRIAREIHDGVAQDLAFLRLKLALWQEWVEADPARMQAELTHTQAVLDKAIEEIRRSIYALRPLALDTQGLLPALRRYAADFSEQHDIFVTLAIDVADDQLPATLELLLFRVIQEALNNVAQHARASLAWVELRAADEAVTLLIRDNGQGFDARDRRAAGRTRGLGLMQMRERVAAAGGRLDVDSRPGQGTAIQAWLPLP